MAYYRTERRITYGHSLAVVASQQNNYSHFVSRRFISAHFRRVSADRLTVSQHFANDARIDAAFADDGLRRVATQTSERRGAPWREERSGSIKY